jgi:hypothetical protein
MRVQAIDRSTLYNVMCQCLPKKKERSSESTGLQLLLLLSLSGFHFFSPLTCWILPVPTSLFLLHSTIFNYYLHGCSDRFCGSFTWRSPCGKLAQYSDKNEHGRPLCPNIHPNFSWMKVRTDFHGLTFCRRAGHFSRESCNTGFHLLLSSVSFGSG